MWSENFSGKGNFLESFSTTLCTNYVKLTFFKYPIIVTFLRQVLFLEDFKGWQIVASAIFSLALFLQEILAINFNFSARRFEVVTFWKFKRLAATVQNFQQRRLLAQRWECCNVLVVFYSNSNCAYVFSRVLSFLRKLGRCSQFKSVFIENYCHKYICCSIPAKPADNSCRRKEHCRTLKGTDEL